MDKEEIKQAFCHLNEEDLMVATAGVKADKSLTDAVKNRYSLAEKYFIQGAEWAEKQMQEDCDEKLYLQKGVLRICAIDYLETHLFASVKTELNGVVGVVNAQDFINDFRIQVFGKEMDFPTTNQNSN